jgi:hypothetical protein
VIVHEVIVLVMHVDIGRDVTIVLATYVSSVNWRYVLTGMICDGESVRLR